MLLHVLEKEKLINVPKWLADNTAYLTIMGSEAYGVSSGDSDRDIYGFAMPPKTHIFPHLDGYIYGFHNKPDVFSVWTQHHIKHNQYEYDFSVYSIVKYFDLMLECNPSMINSLFVPRRCIIHSTTVSEHLREKRKMFLHKGCKAKFSGFAYSQMHKMDAQIHKPSFTHVREFEKNHNLEIDLATLEDIDLELAKRGVSTSF